MFCFLARFILPILSTLSFNIIVNLNVVYENTIMFVPKMFMYHLVIRQNTKCRQALPEISFVRRIIITQFHEFYPFAESKTLNNVICIYELRVNDGWEMSNVMNERNSC